MEIYSRIYTSSYEISQGLLQIPQMPACTQASIDITLYNTIYNIPTDTVFEFKGAGAYTSYTINAGQYSISSICATMKSIMAIIVADIDLYSDPLTKKLIMVSPTVATASMRFTLSSVYLRDILGVAAIAYTGSLVSGPRVMQVAPGTGIYAYISGLPYANPAVITNGPQGQVFIPWTNAGEMMTNDDRDTPRIIKIYPNQSVSTLNVTFYDMYNNRVNLNGGTFTLCINLLNSV